MLQRGHGDYRNNHTWHDYSRFYKKTDHDDFLFDGRWICRFQCHLMSWCIHCIVPKLVNFPINHKSTSCASLIICLKLITLHQLLAFNIPILYTQLAAVMLFSYNQFWQHKRYIQFHFNFCAAVIIVHH